MHARIMEFVLESNDGDGIRYCCLLESFRRWCLSFSYKILFLLLYLSINLLVEENIFKVGASCWASSLERRCRSMIEMVRTEHTLMASHLAYSCTKRLQLSCPGLILPWTNKFLGRNSDGIDPFLRSHDWNTGPTKTLRKYQPLKGEWLGERISLERFTMWDSSPESDHPELVYESDSCHVAFDGTVKGEITSSGDSNFPRQ